MKRIVAIVLLLCTVLLILTSCFESDNECANHDHSQMSVTFVDGDNEKNISITKEVYYIDVSKEATLTKSGYICLGYYTEKVGGKMIFDSNGIISPGYCFKDGSPTKLYAQWKTIDDISYFLQENGTSKFGSAAAHLRYKIDPSEDFKRALEDNPDKTVRVTVSFDIKYEYIGTLASKLDMLNPVRLGVGSGYYDLESYYYRSITPTESYTHYTYATEILASELEEVFYVGFTTYNADAYIYCKGFSCLIEFT